MARRRSVPISAGSACVNAWTESLPWSVLARRDPDLIPVLEDVFRYELEIWVAMHEDLKTSRRMRLTFDWLVKGMGAYERS